nr:hypothetical protein [Tanacetum cinerariifolium]
DDALDPLHDIELGADHRFVGAVHVGLGAIRKGVLELIQNPVFTAHVVGAFCLVPERRAAQDELLFRVLEQGSIRAASSSSPDRTWVDWSVSAMLIPAGYFGWPGSLANLMRARRLEQAIHGLIGERVTGRSAVLINGERKPSSKKNRSRRASVLKANARFAVERASLPYDGNRSLSFIAS